MRMFFDFLPIILFFIAYKLYGIYTATVVVMVATAVQAAVMWFLYKRVEKMLLFSLALILVLGGATLLFHDEAFVKWKPSVLNWAFALVFLGSQYIGQKTIIERMMGQNISLPAAIWTRLNLSWVIFFATLGFANIYVAFNFDTDTWVNFKLFGMMGLTLAFIIGQAVYLSRHASETSDANDTEQERS